MIKQPGRDAMGAKNSDDQHSTAIGEDERRVWSSPVLEDFELAMEVTAYAGRN